MYLLEMCLNRKESIFQEKLHVGNLRISVLLHILATDLAYAVTTEVPLHGFCITFRDHSRWERPVRNFCNVPKAHSLSLRPSSLSVTCAVILYQGQKSVQ